MTTDARRRLRIAPNAPFDDGRRGIRTSIAGVVRVGPQTVNDCACYVNELINAVLADEHSSLWLAILGTYRKQTALVYARPEYFLTSATSNCGADASVTCQAPEAILLVAPDSHD